MVHLKDIYFENGIITCLYSPEKNGEYGYISYNSKTDELEVRKTTYDEDTDFYWCAVKHKLVSLIGANNLPEQYNLVLY